MLFIDVLKTWFEFRQLNKNEIDAGFVFGRIDNKLRLYLDTALDPSSVSRIIEKLVTETENLDSRLTPHDLRRTFALASLVKT